MKFIHDMVYVEVSGIYNDEATIEGADGNKIKLFIPRKNYEKNPLSQYKVTAGKVRGVCQMLKKKADNSTHFTPEPFPKSRQKMHQGTNYKSEVEVRDGDKIYFNYNELSEETRFEKLANGNETHLIRYSSIFAFVRAGELFCIQGESLLSIMHEEETQEIEIDGEMKNVVVSKSGLILDLKPVKEKRRAVIAVLGKPSGPDGKNDAYVGHEVILGPNKNQEVTVEGKEYYLSNQNGLYGFWLNNVMVPYSDFVVIRPEKPKSGNIVKLEEDYIDTGIVLRTGYKARHIQPGTRVHFAKNTQDRYMYYDAEKNELLLKESFIYAYGSDEVQINAKNNWI